VRIDGVVLAAFEDQASLQQGAMAFAVRFGMATPLTPGDRVTVVGFPSMERFSASVVDAELLGREPGPAPLPLDIDSIQGGVPVKIKAGDTSTPLGNLRPPKSP
jgi:hypothetical protein